MSITKIPFIDSHDGDDLPQQTGDLDGWFTELATSRPGSATHGIGIKDRSLKMGGHRIIIALHMSEFQAVPQKGGNHMVNAQNSRIRRMTEASNVRGHLAGDSRFSRV
jgi:hypothetical protein